MTHDNCCKNKGCCTGEKDLESQQTLTEKSGGSCCGSGNRGHSHSHEHSHAHGHSHNHRDMHTEVMTKKPHDSSLLCLAVVRENSADVVLFDASGEPRTFSYEGSSGRVCFSSHGQDADDLLTPCFDGDGNHGSPEESCFCGLDIPHLHAHLHDPYTCDANDDERQEMAGDDALMELAKLTLYPVETKDNILHIPVTEHMPNECNAEEFFNSLNNSGHDESSLKNRCRMHKVQHDDHVDYLVHDDATGGLHLAHPCAGCGKDDVHGRFRCVGKRRLTRLVDEKGVRLHFFEAVPRPFNILEFFKDIFTPDSGRVAAVRPVETTGCESGYCGTATTKECCNETVCSKKAVSDCCVSGTCSATFMPPELLDPLPDSSSSRTVRSTIVCTQICCSSEIPMINRVMEPLEGISKTMINVPLKQVTVDHDPGIVTAKEIEGILNKNRFGATLKRDGGARMAEGTTGRSQLYVQKICCASEIPGINNILQPIKGVSNVSINVTTKMVYIDHNTGLVSAQGLCDALNNVAFGASIKKDAGKTATGATSIFVKSILKFSEGEPEMESLKELLGTFKTSQIESFVVDLSNKMITVVHNPLLLSLQSIVLYLEEETGLKAAIITDGADSASYNFETLDQSGGQTELEEGEAMPWPKPTVILSGIFWIISMLSYIGGNWKYLKYVGLISVVFGIPGIAVKAVHTLRRFMFDTNCLMLFAAIGAIALEEYPEAAAVTFLFAISEWLEVQATTRARNALSAIVQLRPDYAYVVHPITKEQLIVAASSVPVGAIVAVKTGDKIPCDGVVVEGHSAVDESSLTGESRPIKKGPKDLVSGGTVNCGQNHLMVQTTSTAENSAISRLVTLVEEAQANRSQTEKIVDEFAKVYTPIVVLAALCMCTIPWAFGSETGRKWTNNGLVCIVVACPCALIISTPVTYVAGLAATAQRGILIKGGAHLEALGLVKTICFDKTGTLTQGSFALLSINHISEKFSRREVLEYLVLMEERANHPLALAIVDGARNEGIVSPKNKSVKNHSFLAGEGLSGEIDAQQIYVGNERLFKRLGLLEGLPQNLMNMIGNWEAMAGTVGFMSIEGEGIVCAYCVADAVRHESMEVVEALQKLGISVNMLTGDNNDAARAIGNLVGLKAEGIKSQLLPEEKLEFITGLKETHAKRSVLSNPMSKRQLVCMVGDGVNDAPALAAADIGVAMGVGAALAMETADVTLLDSNLKKLLYSLQMGRRVLWKIKENVAFSLIIKILVLGFTVAGKVKLWAAIASDVGAMIIVTLNGMRLLPNRVIDREKMGDIENVTYHSQVSDMSGGNQKEVEVEKVPLSIDFDGKDEYEDHGDGGCCSGHEHSHEHVHVHDHGHAHRYHEEETSSEGHAGICSGHHHGHTEHEPHAQPGHGDKQPTGHSHLHSHDHGQSHKHHGQETSGEAPVGNCSGYHHGHTEREPHAQAGQAFKQSSGHRHAQSLSKVDMTAKSCSGHSHGGHTEHGPGSHSTHSHSHSHPSDGIEVGNCRGHSHGGHTLHLDHRVEHSAYSHSHRHPIDEAPSGNYFAHSHSDDSDHGTEKNVDKPGEHSGLGQSHKQHNQEGPICSALSDGGATDGEPETGHPTKHENFTEHEYSTEHEHSHDHHHHHHCHHNH